jgi:DEAD/DEAH box helicase domain-containing protein
MNTRDFLAKLSASPDYEGQLVHVEEIPARSAAYESLAQPLAPALEQALAKQGARRFYTHQAEAINAARAGAHVMVATGTASGKTMCYNVPVLQAALEEPLTRALYLFPTKALAQDQLRALQELAHGLKHVRVATYDGDTEQGARAQVRKTATVVLSNPDMLHLSILPNHPTWASFFRHLKVVVLDEAHTYRGVFGSHVACLLRRLRRVCALYGAHPQFILCSATIANPAEHAQRLTGCAATVIVHDGAPQGPRQFALWNPPAVDKKMGVRRSANTDAAWISSELVKQGLRHIAFTRTRKVTELLLLYVQDALRRQAPHLVDKVASYRSGYLAEERRAIEQQLFSGHLVGLTATNALELGIDVGALDATVMVGYPGTIASTWQQAGRAGRGKREALNVLIGYDNPLDQFFMRHPQELFGRSHEHALIDPGNLHILKGHLPCAALESPLRAEDEALFGEGYVEAMIALEQGHVLDYRNERWYYTGSDYPAKLVNLRSSSEANFLLLDESRKERLLEEVDAATAFFRIHPGSIYLHRGASYLITKLDVAHRIALARPVDANYYTQPRELNEVHIIRSLQSRRLPHTDLFFGPVRVTQQVIGFRRRQQFTEAVLSEEDIDLPSYSFETQAFWFEVPPEWQAHVTRQGLDFAGGLHAVEHACIGILPLFAMCDRNDIGGISTVAHQDTNRPQVFIYDGYPGGVGIARKGFELIEELWARTLEVIRACPCEAGCPSCIQSAKCGNNNEPLDKQAAIWILTRLLRAPASENGMQIKQGYTGSTG